MSAGAAWTEPATSNVGPLASRARSGAPLIALPGPPSPTPGAPAVAEPGVGVVRERGEMRFERRMSDAEALMWNVERDPWLNPNGGMICVLDPPGGMDPVRP